MADLKWIRRSRSPCPGALPMTATPASETIMFTDIVGSTAMTQHLGDDASMTLLHVHDTIVRNALRATGGREIKHTGDGIMGSFLSAAAECDAPFQVHQALSEHIWQNRDFPVSVRISAAAGEPVESNYDLFGSTVQLASRSCAHAQPKTKSGVQRGCEGLLPSGRPWSSRTLAKSCSRASTTRSMFTQLARAKRYAHRRPRGAGAERISGAAANAGNGGEKSDPFSSSERSTPVGSVLAAVSVFPAALACLKPPTFAGELKDGTVVDQAIGDHRCRRHGIRKDVRPIGEREVGADGDALAFVPAQR